MGAVLREVISVLDDTGRRLEAAIKRDCASEPLQTQPKPVEDNLVCPFDQPTRIQLLSPSAAQIATFEKRILEVAAKVGACGIDKSCAVAVAAEQQKLFAELPALASQLLNTYDAICAIPDDLKVFDDKVRRMITDRPTTR